MATAAQIERKKNKLDRATAMMKGGAGEPLVRKDTYKVDLMLALNWYNANEESSRLTKYGIEYLKKNKMDEYIKFFNEASDFETNQLSILMRLVLREQYMSEKHRALIPLRLNKFKEKYEIKIEEKVENKKISTVVVPSVDSRIAGVASKHIAEIDAQIDLFCTTKSTNFSLKDYLLKNSLSGAVAKKIGEYYNRLSTELSEAVKGKDEDLNEGYAFLSTAQLKKFQAFVNDMIADCQQQIVVAKANRAPRAKKVIPAGIQVAKMQYLVELPNLKLKSIHPTKIIGAQQLWAYNAKNKKLAVYYASGSSGFSVRGTTLLGWDADVSAQNGLRKPAITISEVMSGSNQQLQKLLGKLTTISTKPNGRINSDTILLRIL